MLSQDECHGRQERRRFQTTIHLDAKELILKFISAKNKRWKVRVTPLLCVCRSLGESNAVHTRQPLMRKAVARRAAEIYKERFEEKQSGTLPVTFQARAV